ncbi:MAG: J domain-containing protein [Pyrinomonadaceae bacterium]|nr:J domain-containing protein [Pyrinomonadaceae bacterium]
MTKKAKRGFMDGYETYDPDREGYGAAWQWRQNFRARMGADEAREVLKDESPHGVLGLTDAATWNEIKRAYRTLAMKFHPDHATANGITEQDATQQMKRINAAYVLLEARFGKA